MVGDVEEYRPVALLGACADELEGLLVTLEKRRQELGDERLGEDLGQRHLGEQGNQARDESRVLGGLDHQGELHGGRGHFHGGLGALVERAVDDVGPVDQLGDGPGVEAEAGGGDIGQEAGTGDVGGVEEFARGACGVLPAALEVLLVLRRKEGGEVVIEPPGNARRSGVFEVDDGVLVAGKVGLIEERAGAVNQAVVGVLGGMAGEALAVESGKERG